MKKLIALGKWHSAFANITLLLLFIVLSEKKEKDKYLCIDEHINTGECEIPMGSCII